MHFFRLRLVGALLLGITLISVGSTYFDVLAHRHTLRVDLQRRTQWFGTGLQPALEQQFKTGEPESVESWSALVAPLRQHADQPSLAVFDNTGALLASAGEIPAGKSFPTALLQRTLITGKEATAFARMPTGDSQSGTPAVTGTKSSASPVVASLEASSLFAGHTVYEDAIPLHAGDHVAGALLMLADADYIRNEEYAVWRRSFFRIAAMVILVVVVTLLTVRWFLQQPVTRAADWLRRLRHGEAGVDEGAREFGYLLPLAKEVTSLAENLTRARAAAESEARLRDRNEHVWTAERLAVHVRERLGDGKLFLVSNREPYIHERHGGAVECVVPSSGLVTAIEPILRACDGTWVAHGSGNEDAAFVDAHDRLRVPPDEQRYTLRRVWLSDEEVAGYYEGFANEGIWPLCHIAHTRPIFRASDWAYYQSVNRKFADVLLEEMRGTEHPVVFVQDYHFSLLPKMIKHARPDARVAIFWHIPWPNAEAFGICPWQAELIDGLVAADVVGFHLQSHCNNFLDTVDRVLEARTDREHFSVRRNGHYASVRPFPISVAWDERENEADFPFSPMEEMGVSGAASTPGSFLNLRIEEENAFASANGSGTGMSKLHHELGIEGKRLLLGVDRMDYTKGIVERLLAIEQLLQDYPSYVEQIVFVQIASPSRTTIPSYVALRQQVEDTVDQINRRFQTSRWKPIILIQRQCSHDEVASYYRNADVCMVTSLHDGMNLVAKEYLAARTDSDGVLVLSRFAGAAQELRDALIVNPYDVEQVSGAIRLGLEMSRGERRMRMERMRHQVKENNVYRWASNILTDLCAVRLEDELLAATLNRSQRRKSA